MAEGARVCAVVLTGGRSSRLGGRHKPAIRVGGRTVIDRVVSAVLTAEPQAEVILVGPRDGLSDPLRDRVSAVRERPPLSGPLAAIAAAADVIPPSAEAVVLLGGDYPMLSADTIARLAARAGSGADVVSCEDSTGRLQHLCSAFRVEALRRRLAAIGDPRNVPLRALFAHTSPQLIECGDDELRDIDTPSDLRWAQGR